jgi:hypothetical protein
MKRVKQIEKKREKSNAEIRTLLLPAFQLQSKISDAITVRRRDPRINR